MERRIEKQSLIHWAGLHVSYSYNDYMNLDVTKLHALYTDEGTIVLINDACDFYFILDDLDQDYEFIDANPNSVLTRYGTLTKIF